MTEGLEHLGRRDREILGMVDPPPPPETHTNRVGAYVGYFILYAFLAAVAVVFAMLLVKGVLLVYGWLF